MSPVAPVLALRGLEMRHAIRDHPFRIVVTTLAMLAPAVIAPLLASRLDITTPVERIPFPIVAGFGWHVIFLLATVLSVQQCFASTDAAVLAQLPLGPAERLRATLAGAATSGLAVPMVALAIAVARLNAASALWVIAWLAGTIASMLLGLCAPIVFTLLAERAKWRSTAAIVATVAFPPIVILALANSGIATLNAWLTAVIVLVATLMTVGYVVGPGAARIGRAFERAHQATEARQTVFLVPPGLIARPLARVLRHRRSATWAMVRKDLLTQSRDPMHFTRIAMVLAAIPLYLLVHDRVQTATGLSDTRLATAFVAVICCYSLIDISPSPLGAEGSRMIHFLLAGASPRELLGGKLLTYLYMMLIESLSICILLVVFTELTTATALAALPLVLVIVAGATATLVLLSATDIDLDLTFENETAERLAEHLPFSRPRLLMLTAMSLLMVDSVALLVLLDGPAMVALILAEHAVVVTLSWLLAWRRLNRLAMA